MEIKETICVDLDGRGSVSIEIEGGGSSDKTTRLIILDSAGNQFFRSIIKDPDLVFAGLKKICEKYLEDKT